MSLPVLKRSADRKVTNGIAVSKSGNVRPVIGNSFGLPSGKAFSCPGATSVCEDVCYAGRLEKLFPGVRVNLAHNWDAVRSASEADLVTMLSAMVAEFVAECDKHDAKYSTEVDRAFRIHWDGDFFSLDYARAWSTVIANTPDVHFWVYTRSFTDALNVLPVFDAMDRSNLSLYLSVDSANIGDASKARRAYPWTLWAFLSQTFASGREEMADNGAGEGRKYNCPENGGRIALIDAKGSACIKCGICPKGRGDVLFSIRKR